MKFDLLLYGITDRTWSGDTFLEEQIEQALKGGVTMLQLREKNLTRDSFLEEALRVKKITDRYGVPLIINDDISVALACGAAGAHIGQQDLAVAEARRLLGPDRILGVTAKTVEQAVDAQRQGADYLGSGAVFGTSTKKDARPMTLETLRKITEAVKIPVAAIGGICKENVGRLSGAGIAGAAVVSGIFAQKDITGAARALRQELEALTGRKKKTVLSIAGSDCSGGAGIQADLKTMEALGVYGMSVVTALTAQNTTGVFSIQKVPGAFTASQIDAVCTDLFPDAVKIGMLGSAENILTVAEKIREYRLKNIVADPVMASTTGRKLLPEPARKALKEKLFPAVTLITPNLPEGEILLGGEIRTRDAMESAARRLGEEYGCSVLLKGGHLAEESSAVSEDVLYAEGKLTWFQAERIWNPNSHGTGCTLSSAIACGLAQGFSMEESVQKAKSYLSEALRNGLYLGAGQGPLNHQVRII